MAIKTDQLKEPRQRKYLAKDFDSFRAVLLDYARQYYPDRLKDFSESSLGGLFLDFAAYVGDTTAFYLDHQFQELDPSSAFETANIERHLASSGVKIVGSSPAIVPQTFYVQIPAETSGNSTYPKPSAIPIIHAGSKIVGDNGVLYNLTHDIDFRLKNSDGKYVASVTPGKISSTGATLTFVMAAKGTVISGEETTETFDIGNFVAFRQITLSNPNITQIISVSDTLGNEYYEVSALTDDVVYKNIPNVRDDVDQAGDAIKVIPAPYRFTSSVTLGSRNTVLTFGGGDAETLEDDILPDPTDFAISFPYRRTFSREAINPNNIISSTKTLGVAASNTQLQVTYRYGGGLNHNAPKNTIRTVQSLNVSFPGNPSVAVSAQVRSSIETSNEERGSGGEDAPSVDELKELIPSARQAQERIVTRHDLIARVYQMPSNFGRVFRAGVRSSPTNPLATELYVVSRTSEGDLTLTSDTVKENIRKFIIPYRMISDGIDILDARIVNFKVEFELVLEASLNKQTVLASVLKRLRDFFKQQNFHIDQPIVISEIRSSIFATRGVISINSLKVSNVSGVINNRTYSDQVYNFDSATVKDVIIPPPGGIFELKYPEVNMIGRTV